MALGALAGRLHVQHAAVKHHPTTGGGISREERFFLRNSAENQFQ
jgi:hypothetical protein